MERADPAGPSVWRRPRTWLLLTALWTLPALTMATALYGRLAASQPSIRWWQVLGPQLLFWYPWVVATPLVVWLAARWPLARGRLVGSALRHLVAAWALGFGLQIYAAGVELLLFAPASFDLATWLAPARLRAGALGALTGVAIYALVLAVTEAWHVNRRLEAQAQQLVRARLQALQAQLRPHFLFNTLHGIAALTEQDPKAARTTIAKLAALLRAVLDEPAGDRVSLAHELEILDRYLEIEQIRFADRLTVTRRIAEDCRDCRVPPLILQPLAENAIRHGVERTTGPHRLSVQARRDGARLVIDVIDDGPGPAADTAAGIGLANVAERLECLYGDAATVRVEVASGGGCRARLVLPGTDAVPEGPP